MLIGLVGAPNKGKSTIFSALTLLDVPIADYPFTTIKPNHGITYATRVCVETELKVKCKPRDGLCLNGVRQLPVRLVDIAGLVPGANLGKGMGSQFLNDLVAADVLIQVIDASGKTDINGNPAQSEDPAEEVRMVRDEMAQWLSAIIQRHILTLRKRSDGIVALKEVLSSFNATSEQIKSSADAEQLSLATIAWDASSTLRFAHAFLKVNKPLIIAANKADLCDKKKLDELRDKLEGNVIVYCSGAIDLALRKAAHSGMIQYQSGDNTLSIKGTLSHEQESAINYMKKYVESRNGTGIQELVNAAVFTVANKIVVYPVENEHKYTDGNGNVLPDALLLTKGSTALDLARSVHTDIADHMLYAVDARSKNRMSKEQVLKDNDVVKIVSATK